MDDQPEHPWTVEEIARRPEQFDFFLAVRLLDAAAPHLPATGTAVHVADERVRLRQQPSMRFPPSTLAGFEPPRAADDAADAADARPGSLSVHFLGLFGPHGPLPLHLTGYVQARRRDHRDTTMTAFLDLFHHRILSLFYRAWASARAVVRGDRADDGFDRFVGAVAGYGHPGARDRDAFPDRAKLFHAGLLAGPKHPDGLRTLLAVHFGVPVAIQEYVGAWLDLPRGDWSRLGAARLGDPVGRRVWDAQHRFRLRLGPLTRTQFDAFLGGGLNEAALAAAVRNWLGDEFAWDANLVLRADQVPTLRLGRAHGGRLGWTSWLTRRPPERDADDVTVRAGHPLTPRLP